MNQNLEEDINNKETNYMKTLKEYVNESSSKSDIKKYIISLKKAFKTHDYDSFINTLIDFVKNNNNIVHLRKADKINGYITYRFLEVEESKMVGTKLVLYYDEWPNDMEKMLILSPFKLKKDNTIMINLIEQLECLYEFGM